jgi:hypothetical protein
MQQKVPGKSAFSIFANAFASGGNGAADNTNTDLATLDTSYFRRRYY